jgi:hypothetical protein
MSSSKLFNRFAIVSAAVLVAALAAIPASAKQFAGTGKVDFTPTTTCGLNMCYTFSGKVKGYPLSGQGMIDESSCVTTDQRVCCENFGTAAIDAAGSNVDFIFKAKGCTKSPTKEKLNGSITIDGGTGRYKGAKGRGTIYIVLDPEDGKGSVEITTTVK